MFDGLKNQTDKVRRAFKSEDEIRREIGESIDDVMEDVVVPQAKKNAPVGDQMDHTGKDGQPGDLQRSIRYGGGYWRDDRYVARVGSNLEYAEAIEKGAQPHEIKAQDAEFLHFYWENEGKYFRGKSVMHPGNEAQYFLADAINDPDVEDGLQKAVVSDYEHTIRFDQID